MSVLRSHRLAVAALVLSVAGPAFADARDDAKLHYSKGTKAYEIGAYDEAIKEYGEAYRLIDDPALLYNLGQAHRLAGHTVEALRAYRMFLLKVPNPPNRPEVEARITELQSQIPAQPKPSRPPTSSPEPGTNTPQQNAPRPSLPPVASASAGPVGAQAARKKLIAGAIVTGIGALAVVGGIICGVLAQNAGNSITNTAKMNQSFDYNIFHAGQTEQAAEIALFAVGGAAVVAGATVMILGRRESTRMRAWLQPLIGRGTTGLSFAGAL